MTSEEPASGAPGPGPAHAPVQSLREQKKLATARDLADAAYTLATSRGYDAVSTDDVATRAGYSRRTFANYYSCKQEAVVDGFLLRIGLRGRRIEELTPGPPEGLPASFDGVIEAAERFVLDLLEGPAVAEIRRFAQMVHQHATLEPYVHAALVSFKQSDYNSALSEVFGHLRVSMFFGGVIGTLTGVIELILGPLAAPRGLPDSPAPADPGPLPLADLDRAREMIRVAFDYLRTGFAGT